jgi:uncharacterized Tic20 family protein
MIDTDPIQDPSEEENETPAELELPTSGDPSETVISAPRPRARPRKKATADSEEKPVEVEPLEDSPEPEQAYESAAGATIISARPEPEPEAAEPEEQPVATIGSEPMPSTPMDSFDQRSSPPPPYTPPLPQPLSESDERTYAMLAHLSILLNLVTGFLGPVAALAVYFIYKDRSRYVRYHAMQSFVFQLVWWLGAGLLAGITWTISGILAVILVGCLLMPIALFLSFIPLAALVYGVIGAIQTNERQDFRYWLIGDWVRGELTGD